MGEKGRRTKNKHYDITEDQPKMKEDKPKKKWNPNPTGKGGIKKGEVRNPEGKGHKFPKGYHPTSEIKKGQVLNPTGRPSHIERFTEVCKEVVFGDINAIILTDIELVRLINRHLEPDEKVAIRTFHSWKHKVINSEGDIDPRMEVFMDTYYEALLDQKINLFEQMRVKGEYLYKWTWLIERKFPEWNLTRKSQSENVNVNQNISKLSNAELKDELKRLQSSKPKQLPPKE